MKGLTKTAIEDTLRKVVTPDFENDLVNLGVVRDIHISDQEVLIRLVFGYPVASLALALTSAIEAVLVKQVAPRQVKVDISSKIEAHAVQSEMKPVPGIKNIIAVGSGKGGVGKSTVTANLALALAAEGARVGILDADIYGPSLPILMGEKEPSVAQEEKHFIPIDCYGLQTMSIGYLVGEKAPLIWRGPMVSGALQQLLFETRWAELDYLLIDLPPGTGDIQLTMAQKIPVSGAIIVTTPQDLALQDAKRAHAMFEKVKVPLLGVVENMSLFTCQKCGEQTPIFGALEQNSLEETFKAPLLGQLPLSPIIREDADKGCPTVVARPDEPLSRLYLQMARRATAALAGRARDYRHFPTPIFQEG